MKLKCQSEYVVLRYVRQNPSPHPNWGSAHTKTIHYTFPWPYSNTRYHARFHRAVLCTDASLFMFAFFNGKWIWLSTAGNQAKDGIFSLKHNFRFKHLKCAVTRPSKFSGFCRDLSSHEIWASRSNSCGYCFDSNILSWNFRFFISALSYPRVEYHNVTVCFQT